MKKLLTLSLLLTAVTVQACTCQKNWFSRLTSKVTNVVSRIFGKKQEPVGVEKLVTVDEEGNAMDVE